MTTQLQRAYAFQADLLAHDARIRDRVREAYMHVCLILFMNIVVGGLYSPGTPVDKGFARNSWVIGINGVAPFRQGAQRLSGDDGPVAIVSVDDGTTTLLGLQIGDEVHLTTNCVYMPPLEDGHSQQAPTGMVWLAINAGPQIVSAVVSEMLS
jgi:hypothetical protein